MTRRQDLLLLAVSTTIDIGVRLVKTKKDSDDEVGRR
jgi:hypothetical protein